MSRVPLNLDPITGKGKARVSKLRFEGEPTPQPRPSITARATPKRVLEHNKHRSQERRASNLAADNTDTSAQTQSPRKPSWDDVALRTKLVTIVALSSVGGLLVGMFDTQFHHQIWPMLLGLTVVGTFAVIFALRWVAQPFHDLMNTVTNTSRPDRPNVLSKLPVNRGDEIGTIARTLRKFSIEAVRDFHDAKQLRRTLDDRIETSTRKATRKLQQLAMRDPLTALGNRRFIEEQLPSLFDSCKASHTDLICVAIDMDNFKKVNDQLGHAAGDDLIVFLGNLIRGSVRHEDIAARLGGDEFIILMPGCNTERAGKFAGHLIALFRQHATTNVRIDATPSLSIGIASTLRDDPRDHQDLLERADANLYHAKRLGKNRAIGA